MRVQRHLRNTLSVIDPIIGADPLISGDCIVPAGLYVDQEQHVSHGTYDSYDVPTLGHLITPIKELPGRL